MRFLVMDRPTVEYLTANRFAQSTEFELGATISSFLKDPALHIEFGDYVRVVREGGGLYFLSPKDTSRDLVVFDLQEADLSSGLTPRQTLNVLQSILRFATRYWSSHKQTNNVKFVQGSSKAIVFPFPRTQGQGYRIAIELEPDADRAAKRSYLGNNLLVYKSSRDEGSGADEMAVLTNYRRALRNLSKAQDIDRQLASVQSHNQPVQSLLVTQLQALDEKRVPHQTFDQWIDGLLTTTQRRFVDASLTNPHRIEGPAGTGKTLCLVLKAIHLMRASRAGNEDCHLIFVVHSDATKSSVRQLFETNDIDAFFNRDRRMSRRSICVVTLQELAASFLPGEISETEFLDPDGYHSKEIQMLHASEAFEESMKKSYSSHKPFLSEEFSSFLDAENAWAVSELLQHEISVVIKGRAAGDLERYKNIPPLAYGLPVKDENDKGFVFSIFLRYQDKLKVSGKFDTDDIVLSAIGQLDTPIWQRRRELEGFDGVLVDETHLFNINELSILHYVTKRKDEFPIAYSVDRSQAVGDKGWTSELFDEAVAGGYGLGQTTTVESVFRSSPEIINLACSVTASGATLFTNFDDPLALVDDTFTLQEEGKSATPVAYELPNDKQLVASAFEIADQMCKQMNVPRAEILIVPFSEELSHSLQRYIEERNKPVEILKRRTDIETVERAHKTGRYVMGAPDFVGGLEFSGVILVGVDKGRVPPSRVDNDSSSYHFLLYASFNRLYVAITRAKYRVSVLFSSERGLSSVFDNAVEHGWLAIRTK